MTRKAIIMIMMLVAIAGGMQAKEITAIRTQKAIDRYRSIEGSLGYTDTAQ